MKVSQYILQLQLTVYRLLWSCIHSHTPHTHCTIVLIFIDTLIHVHTNIYICLRTNNKEQMQTRANRNKTYL